MRGCDSGKHASCPSTPSSCRVLSCAVCGDGEIRAAELLIEGKQSWSTSTLWRAVTNDPEKTHNGQMDVVLALWKNDLIIGKYLAAPVMDAADLGLG